MDQFGEQIMQEILCFFAVSPQHAHEIRSQWSSVPIVKMIERTLISSRKGDYQLFIGHGSIFFPK
jgi:hypothetical protein